jgi:5-methylcytosine-specific restriction protein A
LANQDVFAMGKEADPFYRSHEWRCVRQMVLRRDGYRCVVCGIDVSNRGEARVDHIERVRDGGAVLDPANLRTLCVLHDNQGHREKGSRASRREERFIITGCDPSGMPLDSGHFWNRR